ncbi:GATS protein-like 3 [Irineochytrium annulatum]|nr:GATS protein-like 3 [Irineochytrium annulatum]
MRSNATPASATLSAPSAPVAISNSSISSNQSISILPDRLHLITFPKDYLAAVMHPLVRNLFLSNSTAFFSYTENSREVTVIAGTEVIKEFPTKKECEWISISQDIFKALQIDSAEGLETSGKRINDLSSPLAHAGISIFYLSTYLTDFIFVKEKRLPLVIATLRDCDFLFLDVSPSLERINFTPPLHAESPLRSSFTSATSSAMMQQLQRREPVEDDEVLRQRFSLNNQKRASTSTIPPGGSAGPGGGSNGDGGSVAAAVNTPDPELLADARKLDKRLLEGPSLRLVGLNRDYMDQWMMHVMKVLFYSTPQPKRRSREGDLGDDDDGDEGGSKDVPKNRFFSYTITEEGISLVADSTILDGLEEHFLFGSTEPAGLRCIQVDLTEFGLDRYGIVWSMSQPLVASGVNLLYLSTASAANILVDEEDLARTLRILSVLQDSRNNKPTEPLALASNDVDVDADAGTDAQSRASPTVPQYLTGSMPSTSGAPSAIGSWNARSGIGAFATGGSNTRSDSFVESVASSSRMTGRTEDEERGWEADVDEASEMERREEGIARTQFEVELV